MCGGGERGELLVADLQELEAVADLVEGADQAVDAVARIAVDPLDAPVVGQALEDELRRRLLGHRVLLGRWGSLSRYPRRSVPSRTAR
jgi:hypothetical protein